jgi:hypothetical protein
VKALKWMGAALLSTLLAVGLVGCGGGSSSESDTGTLSLALTDAPLEGVENVKEVNVTIMSIEYSKSGESWQNFAGFEGPQMFNLLELQNGNVAELGDDNLTAGHYTQIRLELNATEEHGKGISNPGCFITYHDSDKVTPLYVPSGAQTGIKLIGEYDVPVNGVISLTIDFDIRKSIVVPGNLDKLDENDSFKLKPTLRLIVDNEAGEINGTIEYDGENNLTVYAYEDGTYDDNETNESAEIMFPNAVTSVDAHADGSFKLSFLAAYPEPSYDLVVAEYNGSNYMGVYGFYNNIIVNSGETTEVFPSDFNASYLP